MFYLTTHSTHFIYGCMASDIGYSFRLAARVLLYVPSHRQDNTYHGLCYTSRGNLDKMIVGFFSINVHKTMEMFLISGI